MSDLKQVQWRPTASLESLRARAAMLATVRSFFAERGVLEVDTPLLSAASSADPNLASLSTRYSGPGAPAGGRLWLQASPEFAMKRLLADDSGCIYQICHAFRDAERGPRHNPEFTLLEWYRVGFDHHRLMDETSALVGQLIAPRPVEKISYRRAFLQHAGIDPFHCSVDDIRACAIAHNIPLPALDKNDRDGWLDLLLSLLVSPRLGQGTFTYIHDFPPSQAALARLRQQDDMEVAERFELFIDGMEIANGYHELTDPQEQAQRFAAEQKKRAASGQPPIRVDRRLLAALASGLPDCAGVALGVDRLLMLALDMPSIDRVIAFPVEHC